MDLNNFDNNVIKSWQIVTGSKDVIFGSFIDLEENNTMCNSYGLVFEYNMLVLPGCNTIQVNKFIKAQE